MFATDNVPGSEPGSCLPQPILEDTSLKKSESRLTCLCRGPLATQVKLSYLVCILFEYEIKGIKMNNNNKMTNTTGSVISKDRTEFHPLRFIISHSPTPPTLDNGRTFFALHLYKILPWHWNLIGLFCIGLAVLHFAGSIWLSYNAITGPDINTYRIQWGWLILTLLSTGCAIDVVIAASMLYYLISKREGRFNRATRLIDSLELTSLGAIIMVIKTLMRWYSQFVMLKETLYSNSLLSAYAVLSRVILNERTTLRSVVEQSTSLKPSNGFHNRSGHLRRDTKIKPFAFSDLASSASPTSRYFLALVTGVWSRYTALFLSQSQCPSVMHTSGQGEHGYCGQLTHLDLLTHGGTSEFFG
ncbi:hypothetical protein FA15DRAFT_661940 [Coprinopsis marcescibilis]|uniref:Uncharacterized protein n=1 Tax=Coprinopsis marcescibilis TaxID=230819 RepID=A0A5C3K9J9_COPMA|nr:hypothetical protein FA15DRAFT_661940 [Coprinopsis marcescibilis]